MQLLLLFAALGLWGEALGQDLPSAAQCCPRALLSGCPDDYCRKPWPNLCRLLCPDH
jgi:hypothetical protein